MRKAILFMITFFALNLSTAKGEVYCTTVNLCYQIPEGFYLITKEYSGAVARDIRRLLPAQNIGIYADLYRTFYENKVLPVDRAYIAPVESGMLFLLFTAKGVNEQTGPLGDTIKFFKEAGIFRSGPWPTEKLSSQNMQEELTRGLKEGLKQPNPRTGIASASAKILWFSSSKKYLVAERSIDVTDEVLKRHSEAGIPQMGKAGLGVATSCYALQCNEKGLVLIQFFTDTEDSIDNYYLILKSTLDSAE